MEAIVLAGGLGTRLQSVVSDLPKPMAPIDNKPFLEYLLKYLVKNDIKTVILSVGYKWKTIEDYFGHRFENIELIYSVEKKPLGTGGAINKAMRLVKNKTVFIINGDTFFNVHLKDLALINRSKLILSLKQMHNFDRYGNVQSDENGFVTAFVEKEYREIGNINGGIYLASKNIFDSFDLGDNFSFEEFIQNNFKSLKITSKIFKDYFIDIGIPEDYVKAQVKMKNYL